MLYHVEHCGFEVVDEKLNKLMSDGWKLKQLIPHTNVMFIIVERDVEHEAFVEKMNKMHEVRSNIMVIDSGVDVKDLKKGWLTWPWQRS